MQVPVTYSVAHIANRVANNPHRFFNKLEERMGSTMEIEMADEKRKLQRPLVLARADHVRVDPDRVRMETVPCGVKAGKTNTSFMGPNESAFANLIGALEPDNVLILKHNKDAYFLFPKESGNVQVIDPDAPIEPQAFVQNIDDNITLISKAGKVRIALDNGATMVISNQEPKAAESDQLTLRSTLNIKQNGLNKLWIGAKRFNEFLESVFYADGYGLLSVQGQSSYYAYAETPALAQPKQSVTAQKNEPVAEEAAPAPVESIPVPEIAAPAEPAIDTSISAPPTETLQGENAMTSTETAPPVAQAREIAPVRGICLQDLDDMIGGYGQARTSDLYNALNFFPSQDGKPTAFVLTHNQQSVGIVLPRVRFKTGELNDFAREKRDFTAFTHDLEFIKKRRRPEIISIPHLYGRGLIFMNSHAVIQLKEAGYLKDLPENMLNSMKKFVKDKPLKQSRVFRLAAVANDNYDSMTAEVTKAAAAPSKFSQNVVSANLPKISGFLEESAPVAVDAAAASPVAVAVPEPTPVTAAAPAATAQESVDTAKPEFGSYLLLSQIIDSAKQSHRIVQDRADGSNVNFLEIPKLTDSFQAVVDFHNYLDPDKAVTLSTVVLPAHNKAARIGGLKDIFSAISSDKNVVNITDEVAGTSFLATKNNSFVQTMQDFKVL